MHPFRTCSAHSFAIVFIGLISGIAIAQVSPYSSVHLADNVLVPQAARITAGSSDAVDVRDIQVGVVVIEQVATTTMDVVLENTSGRPQEAELLLPVPDGATVRTFAFEGQSAEPTAKLLDKSEAGQVYDSIVRRLRDPALLEFAGYSLIRSSVFPVPAHGKQKVRLTYEHLLTAQGDRVDYVLPRSQSLEAHGVPWTIHVRVKSKRPLATVYCPSHDVVTKRTSDGDISITLADAAKEQPGPFRLSWLWAGEGVTASLLAYPDTGVGGGYFLLFAGLPPGLADEAQQAVARQIILVLDRSGSMSGDKIEQARAAGLQILEGLKAGEQFNIIDYSDSIQSFSATPVASSPDQIQAARQYLQNLRAGGGTNLHDALTEALRQPVKKSMLPIVLFLTDGLPTVGVTSEVAIRNQATSCNTRQYRIFTFGVGYDVNAPLLTHLARNARGMPTFVQPNENVEAKVTEVYRRLFGPVLAGPTLDVLNADGSITTQRVRELMPAQVPDLFDGDQLVVLGQYAGDDPLRFRLQGTYLGKPKAFEFRFDVDHATTRNAFVPRLWASRKIGTLVDAIAQAGAEASSGVLLASAGNPTFDELSAEVVKLSREFGVLTEYTAFLATEGTDLSQRDVVLARAREQFQNRAIATRSGIGAMNQAENTAFQSNQAQLNAGNRFYDARMNRVSFTSVQQVDDRAFFRRNNRWVDSRVLDDDGEPHPSRTIEFGSDAFRELLQQLIAQNRQGTVSLRGDIVLQVDGDTILVKAPEAASPNP